MGALGYVVKLSMYQASWPFILVAFLAASCVDSKSLVHIPVNQVLVG